MMSPRLLPEGPWKSLFSRAVYLLDDLRTKGGAQDPFWTFGGGTVLMLRYDHRASKDIDIFVADPQYLGYLTPRLSDKAAELTSHYVEDASSYVKLQFEEGEIDFVAAANLLDNAWGNGGRYKEILSGSSAPQRLSPRKCTIAVIRPRRETCLTCA